MSRFNNITGNKLDNKFTIFSKFIKFILINFLLISKIIVIPINGLMDKNDYAIKITHKQKNDNSYIDNKNAEQEENVYGPTFFKTRSLQQNEACQMSIECNGMLN